MNRVVRFEIHAKNADVMHKFYEDVFGWKITDLKLPFAQYRSIVTGNEATNEPGSGINGALIGRRGSLPTGNEPVNAFVCTIDVEDIDATLLKIKECGGTTALEKMQVAGVGFLAYQKDPEGNIFGVLQRVAQ
jgi:uncharacterized protein